MSTTTSPPPRPRALSLDVTNGRHTSSSQSPSPMASAISPALMAASSKPLPPASPMTASSTTASHHHLLPPTSPAVRSPSPTTPMRSPQQRSGSMIVTSTSSASSPMSSPLLSGVNSQNTTQRSQQGSFSFRPTSSRLTSRSDKTGEEEPVKESTLLVVWRFIIKLKRKVASLVKSLQKKSTEIHRMLITRFPILSRVPPVLMQQLCLKAQKKLFQRKYTLIQQGSISEWIYIVRMGSLAIYQQSEHVLSTSGGMAVGLNTDVTGGGASSLAASSKKFESLHIGDVHEGDEAGLYGLLRPPTIVMMERRNKKKTTAEKAAESDSSSEDEEEQKKRKRTRKEMQDTHDYHGGYVQPHTVIANQPSIVYALSARLFREMLLSVPELYVEIREEMTNKYLVRLKRFEVWEIQRMKLQKIKQIQQTLIESTYLQMRKNENNGIGGKASSILDSAALRNSFAQAEALVARDTIADLFHGQKKMFTINALALADDELDGSDEDETNVSYQSGAIGSSDDVLISQWNEKQNGLLDEMNAALSKDAPHHPAPSFGHQSILSLTGASSVKAPPIPYVDSRKLVGTRREYNYKAAIGPPSKHHMIPTSKPTASAAGLIAHAKEHALEQQLLTRPSKVISATTAADPSANIPSSYVQQSDGSYISPEELAYQKRILKMQSKQARKEELNKTHEEEKFLEDILTVSQRVNEMYKQKPPAIAVESTITPNLKPRASKHQSITVKTSNLHLPPPSVSDQPFSPLTLNDSPTSSPSPSTSGFDNRRRGSFSPTSLQTGKSSFNLSIGTNDHEANDHDMPPSTPATPPPPIKKERNPFVNTPPLDIFASPPRIVSSLRAPSVLGNYSEPPAIGASTLPPAALPPENPDYADLPTLPSPQLKSLFALLSDTSNSASSDAQPALLLLNTVETQPKVFGKIPLPIDEAQALQQANAAKAKLLTPAVSTDEDENNPTSPKMKHSKNVLLDLKPVVIKSRPLPTVSKYDLDAPFASTAVPPSFHSLAFHSFPPEAWKGIARVPTPPLIPPTIEDPRKVAIRQGLERAQFRVQSRSREGQVGFKEFSRDNNKSSVTLHTIVKEEKKGILSPGSPSKDKSPERAGIGLATKGNFLSPGASAVADAKHDSDVSVLSKFANQKAKEEALKQSVKQKKQFKEAAEERARKRALHNTDEVRQATLKSTTISEDDPDVTIGVGLPGPLSPARSAVFSSTRISPHNSPMNRELPSRPKPTLVRHDTFQSTHHRRVLGKIAPGVAASIIQEDTPEELEFKAKQAAREHAKRLELLTKDRLKPAPGIDAETMRKQFEWERQQQASMGHSVSSSNLRLQPLEEESKWNSTDDTTVSSGSGFTTPPSVTSPPKSRKNHLGHSSSLPSFLDASSGVSKLSPLVQTQQSSLSSMLSLANKTTSDLVAALPTMYSAFEDAAHRGNTDPADRAVIDALTLPAHMLNSKVSDVAGRLAAMLRPFVGTTPISGVTNKTFQIEMMKTRGIHVPSYEEPPEAQVMIQEFQKNVADQTRKRVAADQAQLAKKIEALNLKNEKIAKEQADALILGGQPAVTRTSAGGAAEPQYRQPQPKPGRFSEEIPAHRMSPMNRSTLLARHQLSNAATPANHLSPAPTSQTKSPMRPSRSKHQVSYSLPVLPTLH